MRVRLLACLCLLVAACEGAPQAPLVASNVEITPPTPGSRVSAGYMLLTNNTQEVLRITRITSPQFEVVAMHETRISDDGVARMRPIDAITIDANGTRELARGGMHLMLMQPRGEFDDVSLAFHAGDVLLLTLQVGVGET